MSESSKHNPEVKSQASRRRFNVQYKRRIVAEVEQYQYEKLGKLKSLKEFITVYADPSDISGETYTCIQVS